MSTFQVVTPNDLSVATKSLESKFQELMDIVVKEKSTKSNEETFLTKEETSKLLRCSIPTVNRRVSQGILSAYKIKGDTVKTAVRFKKSDVLNLFTPSSYDTIK
ncbi:helix-turn-helix domain-containing protein [Polaribacter sp. HL-MS24]|uniref:helix-turn-helix domain-containing protein n=1 Tax=Polaribacter sp. HL-MS24 TaxID=3077735 RepID=UPI002934F233|nr:helix-turn-helix domain-containing protein [Polaribacter sp. HL-MS24]WOC41056.1 helix-turn-helix domain-containing protein [Polaribacter sp. HL-MS24]